MQALASRIWTPEARHHPGQLAWSYAYGLPEELHHGPAALFDRDDEVVAWAWAESDDWLELCVDPTALDAGDAAIAWFLERADGRAVRAMALDTEEHVIALLDRAGFLVEENVPWFTHHFLDLAAIADAPGRGLHPATRRTRGGRRPRGVPPRRLECDLEGQHRRLRAADAHPALPTRPRLGRGRRHRPDGRLGVRLARAGHRRRARRAGRVRARAPRAAASPARSARPPSSRPATPAPPRAWCARAATTATRCPCASTSASASSPALARSRWCGRGCPRRASPTPPGGVRRRLPPGGVVPRGGRCNRLLKPVTSGTIESQGRRAPRGHHDPGRGSPRRGLHRHRVPSPPRRRQRHPGDPRPGHPGRGRARVRAQPAGPPARPGPARRQRHRLPGPLRPLLRRGRARLRVRRRPARPVGPDPVDPRPPRRRRARDGPGRPLRRHRRPRRARSTTTSCTG